MESEKKLGHKNILNYNLQRYHSNEIKLRRRNMGKVERERERRVHEKVILNMW
jgi:hypothetical protein